MLDDVKVAALPKTVGYINSDIGMEAAAEIIAEKVRRYISGR